MIEIDRIKVIEAIQMAEFKHHNSKMDLTNDAIHGTGELAVAFLIKRAGLKFDDQALLDEIDFMVENSLITLNQEESMKALLLNARNGNERVVQFLKRKRRFVVIG